MNKIKSALLKDITSEPNVHLQGLKKVFIKNSDSENALTQFAYGCMEKLQQSGNHSHQTMDEYFYFLKGKGTYKVENDSVIVYPTTFIKIPAGTQHNLINSEDEPLEFIYFGIALSEF